MPNVTGTSTRLTISMLLERDMGDTNKQTIHQIYQAPEDRAATHKRRNCCCCQETQEWKGTVTWSWPTKCRTIQNWKNRPKLAARRQPLFVYHSKPTKQTKPFPTIGAKVQLWKFPRKVTWLTVTTGEALPYFQSPARSSARLFSNDYQRQQKRW